MMEKVLTLLVGLLIALGGWSLSRTFELSTSQAVLLNQVDQLEFREIQTENAQLKQQLELMKMCGKVNNNPTIARNPNFALLVSKCSGIIIPENKKPDKSHWDVIKDNYKKENPDIKLMGDKFIGPNE